MPDTAVITDIGRQEITTSKSNGLQVSITGATFGGTLISSDPTVLTPLTALPSPQFTCDSTLISYKSAGQDKILFTVRLSSNVGDFPIGSWGLLSSAGNLITVTSLNQVENKYKSTSNAVGNIRFYQVIINVSSMSSILNLSLLISQDASLPEVGTENELPAPNASTFPVYYVDKWLAYHGKPALASRLNGQWYFYPAFEGSRPELFDSSVLVGNAVYFDQSSGRFQNSVANNIYKAAVGLRGQNSTLISLGDTYIASNSGTFVPGAQYYVDSANPGRLSTTISYTHVGYAVSDTVFVTSDYMDAPGKVVGRSLTVLGDNNGSIIDIIRQDSGPDSKTWSMYADITHLYIATKNDNGNVGNNFLTATRSGSSVTNVNVSVGGYSLNLLPNQATLYAPNGFVNIDANNIITSQSYLSYFQIGKYYLTGSISDLVNGVNVNYSNTIINRNHFTVNINGNFPDSDHIGNNYPVTFDINNEGFNIYDQYYDSSTNSIKTGNGIYLNKEPGSSIKKRLFLNGDELYLQQSQNPVGPGRIYAISDLFAYHNYLGNTTAASRVLTIQDFGRINFNGSNQIIRGPGWTIMMGNSVSRGTLGDLIYFPEALYNYTIVVSAASSLSQWSEIGGYFHPAFFGTQGYNQYAFIVTGVRLSTSGGQGVGSGYTYADYQSANGHVFTWMAIGQTAGQ